MSSSRLIQDRTVVIVRDRPSSGGGIYNYYEAICRYLRTDTHITEVGRPYTFYGEKGGRILNSTIGRLLTDWLALLFKILRVRPDLVHVNPCMDVAHRSLPRDAINVLIGRLLMRRVLVFWRGWDAPLSGQPEFPGGNNGWLCRIYKMGTEQVVLSERFRQDLLRWGFKDPIHLETTVVSDDLLNSSERPPQSAESRRNLLYLSRVEVGKGVFELLEAYQILKARNPAYTLTIGGDGPDLKELKDYAVTLGLKDVEFTGFLKGKEKVECFRKGGVFCFLSYTEGMPNAVLEALGMGMPIVSSDAGGLRDILRDGENGFIIPPLKDAAPKKTFDPLVVANAIERLVETPELHERMAAVNWRYARQRFAAPVVARRLEEIYESVMAKESSEAKSVKMEIESVR
jgi:glycosyltransferase involved in cell wall biosynthesis